MNYLNEKNVENIDVASKRVLVRCDFNIPFDGEGNISDPKRIDEAFRTIRYLIDHHAKVIPCSHLGRPKGEFDPKYSLAPVAEYLSKVFDQPMQMTKDVIGDSAKAICASLKGDEIALLENVRFHKGEERSDLEFSKALASLAEIYVDNAFGTAHHAHVPAAGMATYLPVICGYLTQKKITIMGNALANPKRPFIAILGSVKVSDKISVISNLLDKVGTPIIGGGMTYTFTKTLGYSIGTSICEDDKLDLVQEVMTEAKEKNVKLLIPLNNMVAGKYDENANHHIADSGQIPDGQMGLDIGPETQELFTSTLKGAETVVWNGSMGVSEWKNFAAGTVAVTKAVVEGSAVSIIDGGDSAAAVERLGFTDKTTHTSTGDGTSLEFLEGLELSGIACLNDKN